jgi:hypothetical protein
VAERGDWSSGLSDALRELDAGENLLALSHYTRLASLGVEVAQANAAVLFPHAQVRWASWNASASVEERARVEREAPPQKQEQEQEQAVQLDGTSAPPTTPKKGKKKTRKGKKSKVETGATMTTPVTVDAAPFVLGCAPEDAVWDRAGALDTSGGLVLDGSDFDVTGANKVTGRASGFMLLRRTLRKTLAGPSVSRGSWTTILQWLHTQTSELMEAVSVLSAELTANATETEAEIDTDTETETEAEAETGTEVEMTTGTESNSAKDTRARHFPLQTRALLLLRLSAAQGNAGAYMTMGDLSYYGHSGRPPDGREAASHYEHAAHLKDPRAIFNMGTLYEFGVGVPQDFHLAKRYYDQAAESSAEAHVPATIALVLLNAHRHCLTYVDEGLVTHALHGHVLQVLSDARLYTGLWHMAVDTLTAHLPPLLSTFLGLHPAQQREPSPEKAIPGSSGSSSEMETMEQKQQQKQQQQHEEEEEEEKEEEEEEEEEEKEDESEVVETTSASASDSETLGRSGPPKTSSTRHRLADCGLVLFLLLVLYGVHRIRENRQRRLSV